MSAEPLAADVMLVTALECAVPLRVMELRGKPGDELLSLAREAGQHVASHGDVILHRGKKKGETARAFSQLVTGLAVLVLTCPGGADFAGRHWEAAG
jgi:hypothetical protein